MNTRHRNLNPLGHATRRAILILLRDGEQTAGAIAEKLAVRPSSASLHFRVLLEASLINVRSEMRHRFYSIRQREVLLAWDAYVRSVGPHGGNAP